MAAPTNKSRKGYKTRTAREIILQQNVGNVQRRPGYGHNKLPWQHYQKSNGDK